MANPILRKLSKPGLSNNEIADLLEKHIGHGENEAHCRDACDALRRIKNEEVSVPARVIVALLNGLESECYKARAAIEHIRKQGTA